MRSHFVAVLGFLSLSVANAGVIQLGGTDGLTANYINQVPGAVCAAGVGNCLAGSIGSFVERNYDNRLFEGATENGTSPLPYSTYVQGTAETGTLGNFAMINDGVTSGTPPASLNYWNAPAGNNTITVPVGVANVTDVQMMLNDLWGGAGANDTVVTFDFGASSNASTFDDVVVVNLQNAPSSGSGGQIRSAINCSTVSICTLANGALASSSTPTTTLSVNGGPANSESLTVTTQTLFDSAYNGGIPRTALFFNSTGNTVLDAQDFLLASLVAPSASEFLVNIKVQELNGAATGSGASQTALSAITVDTALVSASTPEPSTILLFLSGLGAVGFAKFRKK
jgi:hypothetical protein